MCSRNHNHNHNQQQNSRQQPTRVQSYSEPVVTKTDYAVAKYLKNKLPEKEAMFLGLKRVKYFIGSKAIDQLMESEWAKGQAPLFRTRDEARVFMNELLIKKLYHRARKIVRVDGERKRFKLDMHDEQVFLDSSQPYVWIYDPISLKAWVLSIVVIFAVIAVCLFPLWPPIIRTGVYYICILGLILLTSILVLAVAKHIIFITIRILTFDRLHFWILPNLTEDVGILESFWPLYAIDTTRGGHLKED